MVTSEMVKILGNEASHYTFLTNPVTFCDFLCSQVEVKIDSPPQIPRENILSNFVIEAALYDTGSWYNGDRSSNLLLSNVANLNVVPSNTVVLGFLGYTITGKLEMPKLWSAEQVRNSFFFP